MDVAASLIDLKTALKGPIDGLLKLIGAEFRQLFLNRIWDYQEQEYYKNLLCKTILHRAQPKSLMDFYQPLYLRSTDTALREIRVATESVQELFVDSRQLTFIGFAGSGKSTLVKYLITRCFVEGFGIPVKVELRYLNEYVGSLRSYIVDEIVKFQRIGLADHIIDRMLDSSNFVFFFDGYDELNSTRRPQVAHEIDIFVSRYPKNCYILTSRPNTNAELVSSFTNYEVCDLSLEEIREFIRKQIPAEESELTQKIIESVEKKENSGYRTFLSNPLLLSMFILTFQTYSDIPHRRSEFYNQVFNALFSMHDSMSKMGYQHEKQCGLNKDLFEELLQVFSYISFFEQEYIFSEKYLIDKLNEIKDKKSKFKFDNEKLVDDLQVAIGIIHREGLDYTFPHRSLQEYFAASYVAKLSDTNKEKLYTKIFHDAEQNLELLLDKDHFFTLLVELDFRNVHRHLTIPLIGSLVAKLSEISSPRVLKADMAYHYHLRIFIYRMVLLKSNSCLSLSRDPAEVGGPVVIVPRNHITSFLKEREGFGAEIRQKMPMLKEYVLDFRKGGAEMVRNLEQQILEIETSDNDIIDLVTLG